MRVLKWAARMAVSIIWGFVAASVCCYAQSAATQKPAAGPQNVIIDTDIGDDVDDAFAVALALQSPELKIVGITSAWGNTVLRARLLDRFLKETGHT
ncbi:MAG TPA: nucleoside hydrolase, partial [Bryobacteraceae bacterium]|nr:nucleoside hydrolase [Bryobacteraceae bacterium]